MNELEKILTDTFNTFTSFIGAGMYILPPDNNFLFNAQYDFSDLILQREKDTNLIGVIQKEIPKDLPCYETSKHTGLGFGDSAHHTGVLAFCNSEIDKINLPVFELNEKPGPGFMVRHPTQIPWNNWRNSTRDQLTGYAAGCWRAKKYDIVERLLSEHNKRLNILGFPLCQNSESDCPGTTKPEGNTDFLAPVDVMFLRICSGDFSAYLDPIGQFNLQLAIEAASKDISEDKTHLILESIVCGRLDLFVQIHANYKESIMYYWGERSDGGGQLQPQIGKALILVIEQELKRYAGLPKPKTLGLPFNTIKALAESMIDSLKSGPAMATFILLMNTDKIFQAVITDLKIAGKEIENYVLDTLKNPFNIINIPFMPVNPVAQLINNLFKGTDLSEVYSRLNEIQNGIIKLTKLVEELKDDIKAVPERVAAYEAQLNLNNDFKQFEIYYQSYCEILDLKGKTEADKEISKFEKLAEKLLTNIINFSTINKTYPYSPVVNACMDIHLSCLAIIGENPTTIKKILEIQYKPWFESILNDSTDQSLSKTLTSLQNKQAINKLSVPPLYTLKFMLTQAIGLPAPPNPGDYYIPDTKFIGNVVKYDYFKTKQIDEIRFINLKSLLEKKIISEEDFPEELSERIVQQSNFEFTFLQQSALTVNINIALETYEGVHKFYPSEIIGMCHGGKLNHESSPFPQQNFDTFKRLKIELISDGESIIRHAKVKDNCQLALEKIDEVIKTCDELLKN